MQLKWRETLWRQLCKSSVETAVDADDMGVISKARRYRRFGCCLFTEQRQRPGNGATTVGPTLDEISLCKVRK